MIRYISENIEMLIAAITLVMGVLAYVLHEIYIDNPRKRKRAFILLSCLTLLILTILITTHFFYVYCLPSKQGQHPTDIDDSTIDGGESSYFGQGDMSIDGLSLKVIHYELREESDDISGIDGTFEFSRELTNLELSTVQHSGDLITAENLRPPVSYYVGMEDARHGEFSAYFEDELLPGAYKYILNIYVRGIEYMAEIEFTVE